MRINLLFLLAAVSLLSCNSTDDNLPSQGPHLIFKFEFDENQARLDNFGQPASIPVGHAAQTPEFRAISAHYLELAPTAFTPLGSGDILYKGPETTAGGAVAVDFDQANVVQEGDVFLSVPISEVDPGVYEWVRLSLTYQSYDIALSSADFDGTGTIASFVGFNTYISDLQVRNKTLAVHDDKLQGFWAFEVHDENLPVDVALLSGEAAHTTVPNPIATTSPVPPGSCVVTGTFVDGAFEITGDEGEDVVITLSVSVNQSFEWEDDNGNGKYEPSEGERVVDMGLRGLQVEVE